MKILMGGFAVLSVVASAQAATCTNANTITKVMNVKTPTREYVDFYIKSPFTGTVAVTAAASGAFIQDGSGNPINVAGNHWTDVKFENTDWTCSSTTSFVLPKPVLKDIKLIGQFEGQIEYAIGRHNGNYLGQTLSTVAGGKKRLRLKFRP
jgi:hypothetical protein